MKNGKCQGYSLLELLLVVSVLASLMLTGLHDWQKRQDQKKIERTAAEIHDLLGFGRNYYLKNKQFPSVGMNDWSPQFLDSWLPFIPLQTLNSDGHIKNPWGYDYEYWGAVNATYKKFGVRTTLPNASLAQEVAEQLAFAEAQGNQVTAYMPIPAQEIPNPKLQPRFLIYNISYFTQVSNQDKKEVIVECPSGWTAGILPWISFLGPDLDYDKNGKPGYLYHLYDMDIFVGDPRLVRPNTYSIPVTFSNWVASLKGAPESSRCSPDIANPRVCSGLYYYYLSYCMLPPGPTP